MKTQEVKTSQSSESVYFDDLVLLNIILCNFKYSFPLCIYLLPWLPGSLVLSFILVVASLRLFFLIQLFIYFSLFLSQLFAFNCIFKITLYYKPYSILFERRQDINKQKKLLSTHFAPDILTGIKVIKNDYSQVRETNIFKNCYYFFINQMFISP